MTPERARELLAAERERIERSLADLGEPVGTDELSTLDDPADQGSVLYERELEVDWSRGCGGARDARARRGAAGGGHLRPLRRKRRADSRRAARGLPAGGANGGGRAPFRPGSLAS